MKTIILSIIGVMAGLAIMYGADAATPAPILSIFKTVNSTSPVQTGELISYTISITNSGSADSSQVNMVDALPDTGAPWTVLSGSGFDCEISHRTLSCTIDNIVKRHINEAGTDFENGFASVTVYSIAGTCDQSYLNLGATFLAPSWDMAGASGPALIKTIACPTPSPTPSPTATPTTPPPTPTTAIPTESPFTPTVYTSTPIPIITTAIPTPKPPATGSGVSPADLPAYWMLFGGFTILVSAIFLVVALHHEPEEEV